MRLRDGLYWSPCGDRIVFLDLYRDRYFCLAPREESAFRSWEDDPAHGSEAFTARLKDCGVLLSTMLGVSSQLALSQQGDLVQAMRMSTQDNISRAGDIFSQRSLGVQPTLTIRPGSPVLLVVHRDLILAPWHGRGVMK